MGTWEQPQMHRRSAPPLSPINEEEASLEEPGNDAENDASHSVPANVPLHKTHDATSPRPAPRRRHRRRSPLGQRNAENLAVNTAAQEEDDGAAESRHRGERVRARVLDVDAAVSSSDVQSSTALSRDADAAIRNREALLERLLGVAKADGPPSSDNSAAAPPSGGSGGGPNRVHRLFYGIHGASLCAVEAIAAWDRIASAEKRSRNEDGPWRGGNYVLKMLTDLDFVRDMPEAMTILGMSGASLPTRNPFLLPLDLDAIMEYEPGIASQENGTGKEVSIVGSPWKVNVQRVKRAAAYMLSEESKFQRPHSDQQLRLGSAGSENGTALRFPALTLDVCDFEEFTTASNPPLTVAAVVACARILLGCDDDVEIERMQSLTPVIARQMLRLPLGPLFEGMRDFDPDAHVIPAHRCRLVHPIAMDRRLKPESLRRSVGGPVVELAAWVRAVVHSLCAKQKQEADFMEDIRSTDETPHGFFGSASGTKLVDTCSRISTETNPKEANLHTACDKGCVGTEDPNNHSSVIAFCDEEEDRRWADHVPIPVPCLLCIDEGSRGASSFRGVFDEALERGDILRIYHPFFSSNWTVSPVAEDVFFDNNLTLTEEYSHARIRHNENISKDDTIERLHDPYKRTQSEEHDQFAESRSDVIVPSTNVVSELKSVSDDTKVRLSAARIWKLIPEEQDTRPPWRKQYDNDEIPWTNDFSASSGYVEHFGVRVPWRHVERYCRDDPCDPEHSTHRQRLNYFKDVDIHLVIKEAYMAVCQWHPVGGSIDNVKWAKLARKMRFLSTVKNSNHEVDMAFLRQSRDRKLDIVGFESVLRDMTSVRFPSVLDVDAVLRFVLWETVVMLPSVNQMVWKEAKRMAVADEARRVCGQTRIASFFRCVVQKATYAEMVGSANVIAKYARRLFAINKKLRMLAIIERDRAFRQSSASAILCQKIWRGYFRRNLFLLHLESKRELKRKEKESYRTKMQQLRELREAAVVFRKTIPIHGTATIVTICLKGRQQPGCKNMLEIKAYVPVTQETFAFTLNEAVLRDCMQHSLRSDGPLSWNEMIDGRALVLLTDRLVARVLNGRPIILFNKRGIAEKGELIAKKMMKFEADVYILFIHRSRVDMVFRAYNQKTCVELRTNISLSQLIEWVREDQCIKRQKFARRLTGDLPPLFTPTRRQSQTGRKNAYHSDMMQPSRQTELISWLTRRVEIKRTSKTGLLRLVLQCEADEEKMEEIAAKLQSIWRKRGAKKKAQEAVRSQFEKIFDRERCEHCYVNVKTGARQYGKPTLLGTLDLDDPTDEWRMIEQCDEKTGRRFVYYANPATGQTSWFSEEDAARMVQRRFRKCQTKDVVGSKLDLSQVVRAVRFVRETEENFQKSPSKLSHQVNFALLCHCVHFEFDRARRLYKEAIQKSPCHPVIARAYGIFILLACDEPRSLVVDRACNLFKEAKLGDPNNYMFQATLDNFFHWAVVVNPKHPLALLNYALLHQYILEDKGRAEMLYRRALAADPSNKLVLMNYAEGNSSRTDRYR